MLEAYRPGPHAAAGATSSPTESGEDMLVAIGTEALDVWPRAPRTARGRLVLPLALAFGLHAAVGLALVGAGEKPLGAGGTDLEAISVEVSMVDASALESRARPETVEVAGGAVAAPGDGVVASAAAVGSTGGESEAKPTEATAAPDEVHEAERPQPPAATAEALPPPRETTAETAAPTRPPPPEDQKPPEEPAVTPPAPLTITATETTDDPDDVSLPTPAKVPESAEAPEAVEAPVAGAPAREPEEMAERKEQSEPADRAEREPEPTPKRTQPKADPRTASAATEAGGALARVATTAAPTRPAAATASPGQISAFNRRVVEALSRSRPKPPGTHRKGTVRIAFAVAEDGQPMEVRVVQSSGSDTLDAAALAAIRRAKLPAPPAGITLAQRSYVIPYHFR